MVNKIINPNTISNYTGRKEDNNTGESYWDVQTKSWKKGKRWGKPKSWSKSTYKRPSFTEFTRPRGESFTVSGMTGLPEVHISHKAHAKMWALIQVCPIEVSWLSSVIKKDDGNFEIVDVYVPHQECGPATTEISKDGDALMLEELISTGNGMEINRLRCWGHSHVNMHVDPSVTDEDQTQDFLDRDVINDFFIRVIGNKYGELQCHVYMLEQGFILNNPDLKIIESDGDEQEDYAEWATEQIEDKVTRCTYVYKSKSGKGGTGQIPYYGWSGYGGMYDDGYDDMYYGDYSGTSDNDKRMIGYNDSSDEDDGAYYYTSEEEESSDSPLYDDLDDGTYYSPMQRIAEQQEEE